MAKDDETPRTNPAEIESLIKQIRGTNLDPRAKEKVERLINYRAASSAVVYYGALFSAHLLKEALIDKWL